MNSTEESNKESAIQTAHAAIKALEVLYHTAQSAVRGIGGKPGKDILSLSHAVDAIRGQSAQRRSAIERACSKSDIAAAITLGQAYDAASVAIGEAIRRVNGRKAPESQPLIHALVDLWGQCEAGRALWRERYIKWPNYKSVEREALLTQSWMALAATLSGLCVREGWGLEGVMALQGLAAPAGKP